MIGHVVCLENDPKSIERYLPVIRRHHLHAEICNRPVALGNFCDELKRKHQPDLIKAFVLDMHDTSVPDLSEIDLPSVTTLRGTAVGFAVAEQYLRKPNSVFKRTPIALLTNYSIPSQINDRIKKLKKENCFKVLKKPTDLPRFEQFIESIVAPTKTATREMGEADLSHVEDKEFALDIREGVDLVIKMLDELQFSPKDKASALGEDLKNASELPTIIRRTKNRTDIDISNRIDLIIEIKSRLDALSENDPVVQRKWLSKREPSFGKKTPLELIRRLYLEDLRYVLSLLERIGG